MGYHGVGGGIKDAVPGEASRALHRDGSLYPVFIPGQPLVANSLLAIGPVYPGRWVDDLCSGQSLLG